MKRKIRWLDGPGQVGAIDPTGQPWNNTTYQACVGVAIQQCGETFVNLPAELQKCIDNEQLKCIAKAKNVPATMSPAEIKALQTKINNALKQYDYCPIAVDGKIGPETCGFAVWAVKVDPSITVPGYCNTVKPVLNLKDCSAKPGGGGGGAPPVSECSATKPCPAGQECVSGKCVATAPPASKPESKSSGYGLLLLGGAAAAGLLFLGPAIFGKGGMGGAYDRVRSQQELLENYRRARRRRY